MSIDLLELSYDSSLEPGARNAASTCLSIQPHEHVVIVTDRERLQIGAALSDAVRKTGASMDFRRAL